MAGLRLAVAGILACLGSQLWAQERPNPPARAGNAAIGQEYHIEINTLPGCFFSGCTARVSAANVSVQAGGLRVPVRVAQPPGSRTGGGGAVPVHLLVAFSPGSTRPADAELMTALKGVLGAGWLVSVVRADGTLTPYLREAGLRQELARNADAPRQDAGLDTLGGAIAGLRAQPGYRVVMVDLGGRSDDKFVRWLASEADRLSPIYVSDGGKAQMPYSSSGPTGGTGADWMSEAGNRKERAYMDGVFHELRLADAARDALADSRYEYDIRFRAQAGMAADLPVKLTFLDPGTHLPYELRTDLYTVETLTADGKPAQQRADATGRLKTVEK